MDKNIKYLIDKKRTKAELDAFMGELTIPTPNTTYRSLCKYWMLEKILKASSEIQAVKPMESKYIDHVTGEEHGYNPMHIYMQEFTNQQIWNIFQLLELDDEYAK